MLATIVFVWIGSVLPKQYYSAIEACELQSNFTCILLGEVHFRFFSDRYKDNLNLSPEKYQNLTKLQKEQILRLLYLYENGGVYSSLNNIIDYNCLNQFLSDTTLPQLFFAEGQKPTTLHQPNNNFIYARNAKNKELLRIIESIKDCTGCPRIEFTGSAMLAREKARFINVKKCLIHMYDSTWWHDWQAENLKQKIYID